MSLEVIYVTRHGFRSGWSVDPSTGAYTSSIRTPTGNAADPALTSHGVKQAKELGHHLMALDPSIEAVYSSPYYRCLQTINPFVELQQEGLRDASDRCHASATTIRPEYGLSEWFGSAPFEHPKPAAPEKLKSMFSAIDSNYVSALAPSRKGESLAQLYERVEHAVRDITRQCDAEGRRAVVLCTHAAVVIALGRVLTGNIPDDVETEDFGAFTCGLSVYRRSRGIQTPRTEAPRTEASRTSDWECEVNSDCSFLSSGAERGWRFSGDESFPGTGSLAQGGSADSKL